MAAICKLIHLPMLYENQCRERFINYLSPPENNNQWDEYKEQLLFVLDQTHGNKWALIAKFLEGKTVVSVQNHWKLISH